MFISKNYIGLSNVFISCKRRKLERKKKKTEKNYHQYKRCSYYSVSSRCSLIGTLSKLQTFLYNLKHLMRFSMLSIEHLMNAFFIIIINLSSMNVRKISSYIRVT